MRMAERFPRFAFRDVRQKRGEKGGGEKEREEETKQQD